MPDPTWRLVGVKYQGQVVVWLGWLGRFPGRDAFPPTLGPTQAGPSIDMALLPGTLSLRLHRDFI